MERHDTDGRELTEQERELLRAYRSMNGRGRDMLTEWAKIYAACGRYGRDVLTFPEKLQDGR